ncbi:MAG: DUF1634 domain-containing protein [Desulfovibrionaceae bacterium]
MNQDPTKATPEQINYANILFIGAWTGIAIMTVTYIIYLTGLATPHVPLELVVNNWNKGVGEYMHITNSPQGWGWVALLSSGDFMNFIGMALLAVLTIICYLTLIPAYLARKDMIFVSLVIAEVLVLSLAASGLLGSGGH